MNRTVVGIHACREALRVRPKKIAEVFLKKGFEKSPDLQEFHSWANQNKKAKLKLVEEGFLSKFAQSHQGIALTVTETPEWSLEEVDEIPEGQPLTLMALDGITDPHNLGAIMRTAWLAGCKALLLPDKRSAGLTPSVQKVASGGAEHLPLIFVKNLKEEFGYLKGRGFWIYGLALEGGRPPWEFQLPDRVLWVVGAEDKGIRPSVLEMCDERVALPQVDTLASFNASVAASMALYETSRQRAKAGQ